MFFAYDPGDAFETLERAASLMLAGRVSQPHHTVLRAYVLIGYPEGYLRSRREAASTDVRIGFTPHAMLWSPDKAS